MEIKDLAGLSEPLTRLIEVISKGVGAVSAPYLTRKNADAKAHEIKTIAEALGEVAKEQKIPVIYNDGQIEVWQKPEDKTLVLEPKLIEDRASNRLDFKARKEQANIEQVTSVAARELIAVESVSNESPDDDWINRFFQYASEVSSDQMQDLWGRILAGEIRQPGSYSPRTLDFVRNMSKSEAEHIEKFASMAITRGGNAFIVAHDKNWLQNERSIPQGLLFILAELDIMYPTDLSIRIFHESSVEKEYFLFHNQVLIVERGDIKGEIKLPIWKFTSIGEQLLPLAPTNSDEEYLERLGRYFLAHKGRATVANIVERLPGGGFNYNVIREVVDLEETPKDAI